MSKEQEIREVFERFGGNLGTRRLAELLIECGTYDANELQHLAMKQLQNIARRALKNLDKDGLPYAGPSGPEPKGSDDDDDEEGKQPAPVWIQRKFWEYETYEYNLSDRAGGIMADVKIYKRLSVEAFERFGKAPHDPFEWNPD